jgi:hypothetical protein
VNPIVWRAVKVGLVVSTGAGIAALATSGVHALVLDIYFLAMAGVLLLALVRATSALAPTARSSQLEAALKRMRTPQPDSGEPTLARDVELSSVTSMHFHTRLRPVLREIAAHRLQSRYAVDLDAEPARARELLGAAAWDAVRLDRPLPEDRLGPGPSLPELRRIVEEVERC